MQEAGRVREVNGEMQFWVPEQRNISWQTRSPVMDIIIHWGVLRRMREEVDANPVILVSAIILDAVALIAFIVMKALNDPLIIVISLGGIVAIFAFESWFLRRAGGSEADDGETEADAQ